MKNLFMSYPCMFEQVNITFQGKLREWHLNINIWGLNLNLGFKRTSFNMVASYISSINSILPCHEHASYCCIALIVFLPCLPVLSPLTKRGSDNEFDDTDEELYYLRKCQASKTPLFIPLQSHSLAPALFYCIRTTTIHLLHAAVVEPLFLCMTCHCHSKQMKTTSMSRSCLSPDVPTHSCLSVMPATAQSSVGSDSSGMNWNGDEHVLLCVS